LAPEQARDSHHVDGRADLYSLGCTLFYLLAGKPPFFGGTKLEKLVSHQMDEAPRLEGIRSDVPPTLSALVQKLLAKRPEDRYQSAAEVAAVLETLTKDAGGELHQDEGASRRTAQESRPDSSGEPSHGTNLAAGGVATPTTPLAGATPLIVTSVRPHRRYRKPPLPIIAACAVLVVALPIALYLLLSSERREASASSD